MAGALKINSGTKLRIAFDVPIGQVPLAVILLTNFVQTISLARKIAKEEEETAIREALRQLREKNAQESRDKDEKRDERSGNKSDYDK